MDNSNQKLLNVTPLKHYTAPALPTLETARNDPALLAQIPSRWAKKAAVITCLGFAGVFALTGCANLPGRGAPPPIYSLYQLGPEDVARILDRMETAQLEQRVHFGGEGSGPFYIVHFPESEALRFVRAKLEAAGFDFSAAPPQDIVLELWQGDFGITLYDEARDIGLSYISWTDANQQFSFQGREMRNWVEEQFAEQGNPIDILAIYNPGETVGWGPFPWDEEGAEYERPTEENKETARQVLIDRLTAQVQRFIDWYNDPS